MRSKVNVAMVVCGLLVPVFCSGCWIARNWKDYLPIANIGLQKDVRTYVGYFYPQHSGSHALSLYVKKSKPGHTDTLVGLRFKGEVEFVGGKRRRVIPFEKTIDSRFLPRTRFKIHIFTFDADAIEHSELGRGKFTVTVDGDVAGFLEREPDSSICVSFIDAK